MAGAWQAVRQWLAQFWVDLKSSTDAGLLAVPRFLGLLYGAIDTRLPIDQAWRKALKNRLPPHVGWRHALGGIAYLLFILLVVTGVLLAVHYRPSVSEAYPSVQHIVSGVTLGWLMRDLHVWAANLVVIASLAHMARVFIDAAHKPPRETTWLAGVLLLFVVLAFGATGYLLPWDQWAYWAVTEALNVLAGVPLVGRPLTSLVRGDPIVSGATLSRFFAVHVIVLPWIAFALLAFHFTVIRRHGIAAPKHGAAPTGPGRPFFPNPPPFMVAVSAPWRSARRRCGCGRSAIRRPDACRRDALDVTVDVARPGPHVGPRRRSARRSPSCRCSTAGRNGSSAGVP
jgi:cytochrome b6